jgi:hypothetical protein
VSRSVQEPATGSLTSISVVSFHLLLGLPSGLFLQTSGISKALCLNVHVVNSTPV